MGNFGYSRVDDEETKKKPVRTHQIKLIPVLDVDFFIRWFLQTIIVLIAGHCAINCLA